MNGIRPEPPPDSNDRSETLNQVVARLLEEEAERGQPHDDAGLGQRFPNLMPELPSWLRTARRIRTARAEAHDDDFSVADGPCSSPDAEEVQHLQDAMPGYEILQRLKSGGQGVVYRAIQRATRRTVAIKILLDGPLSTERQRQRFAREVQLASKLRHPNIVTLYESGVVHGRQYFAMEYVDGLSIEDYLLLHRPSVRTCVALFVNVCRAIAAAHQRGVIHRDLKPSNILVDSEGEPHVVDFGLAKTMDDMPEEHSVSVVGQVVGTLPYLSPEQASGQADDVDTRSDIYSLGVVLYRMITGTFPYDVKGGLTSIRDSIVHHDPRPIRDAIRKPDFDVRTTTGEAPDDLERVIFKALEKEKERRYQSADALADDLERFLRDEPVEAKSQSGIYVLKKTLRRYRVQAIAAGVVLGVLVISTITVLTLWLATRTERDRARQVAQQAHAMLDEVVNEFETSVWSLAGGTEVRERLLDAMAARLERLRPLVERDVSLEGVLCSLRERQGDISAAKGRLTEAREHYAAARQLGERRGATDAGDTDARGRLMRLSRKLAPLSGDANAAFARAVALAGDDAKSSLISADLCAELCAVYLDWGQFLSDCNRYEEAESKAAAALALAEAARADQSIDARLLELRPRAFGLRGFACTKLGMPELAEAAMHESLRLRKEAVDRRPEDVRARYELLVSCKNVGMLCRDQGDAGQARDLFEIAIRVGDYLSEMEPSRLKWKSEVCAVWELLARLHLAAKAYEQAEEAAGRALDIASSLVEKEPGIAEYQNRLCFARMTRGKIAQKRGATTAAAAEFFAALEVRERLAAQDPSNLRQRTDLLVTQDSIGLCLEQLKQPEAALDWYWRVFEDRRVMHEQNRDVLSFELDFIESQTRMAKWHFDRRQPIHDQESYCYYSAALAALDRLYGQGKLNAWMGNYVFWREQIEKGLSSLDKRQQVRTRLANTMTTDPTRRVVAVDGQATGKADSGSE